MKLRPFQKKFIEGATADGVDMAVLSLPRGNGKSALAGFLLSRILTPGDPLFVETGEAVLCAASIEQARIVFKFTRNILEPSGEYRFQDSTTRISITHPRTNTRLRILSSNAKTAFGLVGTQWAICDEGGSWEISGGRLLHDALESAKGKVGSPLRTVYIGTIAPSTSGWWADLISKGNGFHGSVYVQALQGDADKWDCEEEIRRVNPLTEISKSFLAKLLEERDEARADERLKARFLSYRLNTPTRDSAEVLLTVADWEKVVARPVAPREGSPVIGIDLGAGRSWSAAVALWPSGRCEAIALAPGIPSIEDQEKRDRVPAGIYETLINLGVLRVAEGLRVQPPAQLWDWAIEAFGFPVLAIADRARINELRDAVGGDVPLVDRVTRWFSASEDIRALKRMALDGNLNCELEAATLIGYSLSVAKIKGDEQGNTRLVKRGSNGEARDDVAAALLLAAGAQARLAANPPPVFTFENLSVSA